MISINFEFKITEAAAPSRREDFILISYTVAVFISLIFSFLSFIWLCVVYPFPYFLFSFLPPEELPALKKVFMEQYNIQVIAIALAHDTP